MSEVVSQEPNEGCRVGVVGGHKIGLGREYWKK